MTFSQTGENATANIDTFNDVAGNQTYVDGGIFIDTTQDVNPRQYFSTIIIYAGSTGRQEVLVEGLLKAVGDGEHIPISQLESISRPQGQEIPASALGNENSLTQQPEQPVSFQSGLLAGDHVSLASPVQVWVFFLQTSQKLM